MVHLKSRHILILMLLISFATVLGVLFTAGLPQLARDFGITDAKAQWAFSLYLIGYAIGELPYGPLSNYLGRKKPY